MSQSTDLTSGATPEVAPATSASPVVPPTAGAPAAPETQAAPAAPQSWAAPAAPDTQAAPANSGGSSAAPTVADVEEAMRDVIDPELGINVVDLGLVYGLTIDASSHATIDMTLTSAACPLTDVIEDQTAQALEGLVEHHSINWVWIPPWGPDKITEDGRDQLRALGFNV